MKDNNNDKLSKILNPGIFSLAFIFCLVLGIIAGTSSISNLSLAGAIIGVVCAAIGSFAAFFIIKLIFPRKGKANWLAYLLGILTVILGLAASGGLAFLLGYIIIGDAPELTPQSITFFIIAIAWVIFMIWRGMEAPVFPGFLLGGILGALLFVGATTLIPGLFGFIFKDTEGITENMGMTRIAFAVLGAYLGAMTASLARASALMIEKVDIK